MLKSKWMSVNTNTPDYTAGTSAIPAGRNCPSPEFLS
jgi:hypothetical protein